MAYKEWGDPSNPKVLVCVHGVTRVSDDFDALAQAMEHEYRVICPDVVGRGRSDWLVNPQSYQIPQYVSDMVTLLARLNGTTVDWQADTNQAPHGRTKPIDRCRIQARQ